MTQTPHPHSDQHPDHAHDHNHQKKTPFLNFFECCLGDEPAPLSKKIQNLRENYADHQITAEVISPNQIIIIEKDMIVGDLLINFPEIKTTLEDLHPLGMLSPLLDRISLEIFLSDLNVDPEQICQHLSTLINTK